MNWAVKNPAGTRLDSSSRVNKQVADLLPFLEGELCVKQEKTASSLDKKVKWCSLFSRAAVVITGIFFLITFGYWIVFRRFRGCFRTMAKMRYSLCSLAP